MKNRDKFLLLCKSKKIQLPTPLDFELEFFDKYFVWDLLVVGQALVGEVDVVQALRHS